MRSLAHVAVGVLIAVAPRFLPRDASEPDHCDEAQRARIIVDISADERSRGRLDDATISSAAEAFARCGVVVLPSAVAGARELASAVEAHVGPHLRSRARVRAAVMGAATVGGVDALWPALREEPFLAAGDGVRERDAGRLDFELPRATPPFNASGLTLNRFASRRARRARWAGRGGVGNEAEALLRAPFSGS